jgi:hypothetical protein
MLATRLLHANIGRLLTLFVSRVKPCLGINAYEGFSLPSIPVIVRRPKTPPWYRSHGAMYGRWRRSRYRSTASRPNRSCSAKSTASTHQLSPTNCERDSDFQSADIEQVCRSIWYTNNRVVPLQLSVPPSLRGRPRGRARAAQRGARAATAHQRPAVRAPWRHCKRLSRGSRGLRDGATQGLLWEGKISNVGEEIESTEYAGFGQVLSRPVS